VALRASNREENLSTLSSPRASASFGNNALDGHWGEEGAGHPPALSAAAMLGSVTSWGLFRDYIVRTEAECSAPYYCRPLQPE
jgi:hypothetical protein